MKRKLKIPKIIKIDPKNKKISLSFKLAQIEMQKLEYQKYMQSQDNKTTLGDIMKDQLTKISKKSKKTNKKEEKK
jgi:small subunit ribosomal protein S1